MNTPHVYDFAWMRNGKHRRCCTSEDALLLQPYEMKHRNKQQRALLMLHGFSSSPGVFRYFYPHLKHYDYVFAPQLPGHGNSIIQFSQTSRHKWLKKTRIICRQMFQDYPQVDVLGLSLGGLITCYLFDEFPFNRAILLAPALALRSSQSLLLKSAQIARELGFQFVRNFGGNAYHSQREELLFRQLPLSTVIEILQMMNEFHFHPWTIPTELFLGRYDNVVHSENVAQILQSLPEINIHYLEQSAHILPLDTNYHEIIKIF